MHSVFLTTSLLVHPEESIQRGGFPFVNSHFIHSSKKMKLKLTSNNLYKGSKKSAPGVLPRIVQQTSHGPCQKWVRFSRALQQGEFVQAVLRNPQEIHMAPIIFFVFKLKFMNITKDYEKGKS